MLGIDVTEFAPLNAGETVRLSLLGQELTADVWTDRLAVTGSDTDVVARFDDGPAAGGPAITRRRLGPARRGTWPPGSMSTRSPRC